ncbi:MAG: hypothetical protein EPN46_02245 [Candidimonas sp.]|nr:MAG: hypothetical protein EPN77_06840 [Candidimonas sp.]TAM19528.1 MAG: hypothetical protein EPN62_18275 [Candidimonas sp.]TAM80155.1 MAG: hypothetical protein EPN46_02245 [Candidimonas sp.]
MARRTAFKKMVARKLGCLWVVAGMMSAGLLASTPVYAKEAALTNVTLMLDFNALGRHAPWYVALAKGYYKDAGLNVKIVPGLGTAQSLQALEAGVSQFSFSDAAALVLGRARGVSTAKFVEMNYQKAPYAVFSLHSGANVTKLAQLKGLEVASGAGSMTPKIIRGLMKEKGLDPESVKFINIDGAARGSMLLSGKVPAIETYIFGQVGMSHNSKPGELTTLLLADQGLDMYSNGLLVKEAYIKSHPKVVRAFVKASLMGWHDALQNMGAAADMEIKYVPGLNRDVVISELKLVKAMAVTPEVKAKGLGYIDSQRMQKTVNFIVKNIGVTGAVPPTATLYTDDFLPKPAILP